MPIKDSTDLVKQFAHTVTTGQTDLDYALRTRVIHVKLPADAAASTATEHRLFITDQAIVIQSVKLLPESTVAVGDGTNFATLALQTGDLAGGALAAALVAKTTNVAQLGAFASNVAKDLVTGANYSVAAGQRVCLNVTKDGTGRQLGTMTVQVIYQVA